MKTTLNSSLATKSSEWYIFCGDGRLLGAYDYSQTRAYIERQIQYAKHYDPIFSEGAMKRIYEFAGGIPKLINRACIQSLTYAYQSRCNIVDDRMVDTVLEAEVS